MNGPLIDPSDAISVRLLTEFREAERCFAIYENQLARERPGLAWSLLPFGMSVRDTLQLLAEAPLEFDGPADAYDFNISALKQRVGSARAAWYYRSVTIKTEGSHVHH